jgi:hypothetical protein
MEGLSAERIAAFLAGFAIIGTVMGVVVRGWSSFKNFLQGLTRIVIAEVAIDDEATSQAILAYLVKNYRRSYFGVRTFGGRHECFRTGQYGHVPFELFGNKNLIFWNGWFPFWFNVQVEKGDEKTQIICWGNKPKQATRSSISYIRKTVNMEQIIKKASHMRNELYWNTGTGSNKRFFIKRVPDATQSGMQRFSAGTSLAWYYEGVYRLLSHSPEELGRTSASGVKMLDKLYFPRHVTKFVREVEMWRNRRGWYAERGIPWKRGWLFYGLPGTGKTVIARAVAEDYDMPLFVYSLGQLLNQDLERSWAEMQAHIPCIALFEDFDNVFHGRENVYGKPTIGDLISTTAPKTGDQQVAQDINTGRLSFDCLLNCLDGVEKSEGIFTIITTNHVEKLDPALGRPVVNDNGEMDFISTRPGRIDNAIELGYMSNEDKMRFARRIFFDNEHGYETACQMVENGADRKETPAQFQQRCAQPALDMLWKEEPFLMNGRIRHKEEAVA